ncbi:MAG: MotA/TolQ/ExbB proton channel family protein [Microscillaceae bacterium]|nr:MotA/TolQ/ExbB proton channel family protein [Microscillaceae bacterium]
MLFLQLDSTQALGTPSSLVNEESISILELALMGGPVMLVIALLFFVGLYIFLERIFTLQKATKSPETMMEKVKSLVLSGDLEGAKRTCAKVNNPIARMIEKGLTRIGSPLKNIETSIEYVGKIEVYRLEKNLSLLATVSGAAPMIGFLGTVIGMIDAFMTIARLKGAVDPQVLSSGIYTALITTVGGLIVGILANIAYNYLITRVQKVIHNMEYTAMDFMDLLQEPR